MHLLLTAAFTLLYSFTAMGAALPQEGTAGCFPASTHRIGDGDPHQDHYHQQVSGNLPCGDGGCSLSSSESEAVTVGFSIGPGAGGKVQSPAQWITAGFSVSKSWSETETRTCTGEAGETICIWHRTDHTAYTVEDHSESDIKVPCTPVDVPILVRSPNKKDHDTGYYCVRGESNCRAKGDSFWQNGAAGGDAISD